MKIATVPLEAYRQTGEVSSRRAGNTGPDADTAAAAARSNSITLPGSGVTEAEALKVNSSPSLLRGVLTPDEKNTLVLYFARFGDSSESTQIYDPGARIEQTALTGLKVDFKG